MLKFAEKVTKPPVAVAHPRGTPIAIRAGFESAMARFPTIIAHLAK